MDPGEAEEPDREQLESRVDQLEETVSKMLPDRRGVLKGIGAAAVGGAAVGASSGGASGQSAAGQVGTESEPVDVEAANVTAQSVSTLETASKSNPVIDVTHPDYGAVGDGVTDDSGAINNAIADAQAAGGGIVVLPNPDDTYFLGSRMKVETTTDDQIQIIGNGATVETGGGVSVAFQTRGNVYVEGVTFQNGDSATLGARGYNDENPTIFERCTFRGFDQDGVYYSTPDSRVFLYDCRGENNGRWDVAMVEGHTLVIDGGVFAASGTGALGSIDVEPTSVTPYIVDQVRIEDCVCKGTVSALGYGAGVIKHVHVDNVTMDGAELTGDSVRNWKIGRVEGINGGGLGSINNSTNATAVNGKIEFKESNVKGNPLEEVDVGRYNSFYGFDKAYGGGAILDRNVKVGDHRGVRISNEDTTYINLTLSNIPVESGEWYTVGALVENLGTTFTTSYTKGLKVVGYNDAGDEFGIVPSVDDGAKWTTARFKTGSTVTSIDLQFGSSSSSGLDLAFTLPFLLQGRANVEDVKKSTDVVDDSTPSNGTWEVGDRIIDASPSAGGKIGWVCTSGGSPGTWKPFGAIDA